MPGRYSPRPDGISAPSTVRPPGRGGQTVWGQTWESVHSEDALHAGLGATSVSARRAATIAPLLGLPARILVGLVATSAS